MSYLRAQYDQAKQQLITKLSDSYREHTELTKIGIAGLPFSNSKEVAPGMKWQTQYSRTTQQGSVVPSPSLDTYLNFWRLGQSPDLLERRVLYDEYEKICATSVIIADGMDDLINGGLRQGGRIKVVPIEACIDDERIQDQAASFDEAWQRTMALADIEWQCLAGRSFLRYGNTPVEIVANDLGTIEELSQRAPYAMQINSDVNLKFYPGQRDAYVQFDDAGKNWIARYPDALIVWLMTKDSFWHRYGMSRLFAALAASRALIRAESTLPDSREAGQLEKYERYGDIAGNPAPQDVIDEAELNTPEAKKARGEAVTPFRTRIYNGPVEVGMHAPPTGFYNELGDIRYNAGGVTKRLGSQFARQQIPETMNRATLLRMDEMAFVAQYEFRLQFAQMLFPEIFKRQLAWYNAVLDQSTAFYRIGTSKSKIDPNKITLDYQFQAAQVQERLIEKAAQAAADRKQGGLDWESYVEAAAHAQGKDPEVVKKRLYMEGNCPDYIKEKYDRQAQKQLTGLLQRPQLRAVN